MGGLLIIEIDRKCAAISAGRLIVANEQPRPDVKVKKAVSRCDLIAVTIARPPLKAQPRRIANSHAANAQGTRVGPCNFKPPPVWNGDCDILPCYCAAIKSGALAYAGMHKLIVGGAGGCFFSRHIETAITRCNNTAKVERARIGQRERGENFDIGGGIILRMDHAGRCEG